MRKSTRAVYVCLSSLLQALCLPLHHRLRRCPFFLGWACGVYTESEGSWLASAGLRGHAGLLSARRERRLALLGLLGGACEVLVVDGAGVDSLHVNLKKGVGRLVQMSGRSRERHERPRADGVSGRPPPWFRGSPPSCSWRCRSAGSLGAAARRSPECSCSVQLKEVQLSTFGKRKAVPLCNNA